MSRASTPDDAPPRLILASRSPARTRLLRDSGIAFEQLISDVDEQAALAAAERSRGRALAPAETALTLARSKAEAVAALPEATGALVLGCDSVFELDGAAHGKPHTAEAAIERITAMSGRTGILHTGHWLVGTRSDAVGPTGTAAHTESHGAVRSAEVTFDELTVEQVRAYVATGEPLEVAGSFTIDGYGAAFVTGIRGESHTVLGLSLNALTHLLAEAGVRITELWVPRT